MWPNDVFRFWCESSQQLIVDAELLNTKKDTVDASQFQRCTMISHLSKNFVHALFAVTTDYPEMIHHVRHQAKRSTHDCIVSSPDKVNLVTKKACL